MKVLKVHYKQICQDLSVADGTPCEDIYGVLKRVFNISENIDNFFLMIQKVELLFFLKLFPNACQFFFIFAKIQIILLQIALAQQDLKI